MDDLSKWVMALGALCVLLGFVALLSSKIYIDDKTNAPTEVELPILGKLKSNYPALLFVLVGAALAIYAMNKSADLQAQQIAAKKDIAAAKASAPGDDEWELTGRLVSPDGKAVDLERGVMTLFAGSPDVRLYPDGRFDIRLRLKKGQTLESYLEKIDYSSLDVGSATIYPPKELDAFEHGASSVLESKTALTRTYRPVPLQQWSPASP